MAKVLDIRGMCDDGIGMFEPQLNRFATGSRRWGEGLAHCRVGVSRNTTVIVSYMTYVMKHWGLPPVHLNFEPEMAKPDKGIYCIKFK
jgi:hypothetical protein